MIIVGYPPNIEQIKSVFPIREHTVFTYAPHIYSPSGSDLDRALIRHEETHLKQQNSDPAQWWDRYLKDPQWRLEQELEAYQAQFKKAKQVFRVKKVIENLLHNIATDLSGDLYGNIISYGEAKKLIKNRKQKLI